MGVWHTSEPNVQFENHWQHGEKASEPHGAHETYAERLEKTNKVVRSFILDACSPNVRRNINQPLAGWSGCDVNM